MTQTIIRERTMCPLCGNRAATRIDENGSTILAHRVSRSSGVMCR